MNLGVVARTALKAVQSESIENKILVSKKIIRDLEDHPNEASFRLCRDLRAVLKSVAKDSEASAEQISDAGTLLSRVQKLDPRNQKAEPVRSDRDESIKPKDPVPDGYDEKFINVGDCIDRVTNTYSTPPRYTDLENQRLLETFLGDSTPLDEHSARQIWLHLSAEFKARCGSYEKPFTKIFPQVIVSVQTALCEFANSRGIKLPNSNLLSIGDSIGFCC